MLNQRRFVAERFVAGGAGVLPLSRMGHQMNLKGVVSNYKQLPEGNSR